MAGGVANIWGTLKVPQDDPIGFVLDKLRINERSRFPYEEGSLSYDNPKYSRTYADFFAGRFLNDMEPCFDQMDGYCLKDEEKGAMVLYFEDSGKIEIDLSSNSTQQIGVFVNTKKVYDEIGPCILQPGVQIA